jgi:hypothetical protein
MQSSEKEGAIENNGDNIFQFQTSSVSLRLCLTKTISPIKELGTAARPQFQEVFNQLWNETSTSWVSVPTFKYNRLFLYKILFGAFWQKFSSNA